MQQQCDVFLTLFTLLVTVQLATQVDSEGTDYTLGRSTTAIPGGTFQLGTNDVEYNRNADGEGPALKMTLKPFEIDRTPVTNTQFRAFVRATKYKTEAEQYGWSFVLALLAPRSVTEDKEIQKLPNAEHWLAVGGAWWRQPEGPASSIKGREDHPAVHISLQDAAEFCKWAGKRLPNEAEWEHAARGGTTGLYPWGKQALQDGGSTHMMNVWQGKFPSENTAADGHKGTAPVEAYEANAYGVSSMLGNVWEWTSTVYSPPQKGKDGKEEPPKFVLRGGSFVDSADGAHNHKVRVTTRMGNTPDSGGHNTGFRCAKDGPDGPQAREGAPRQPGGQPTPRRKGGLPAGVDQEMLQQIVAEKGVEGLQEFMRESGMGGSVMTPAQLKEKQTQIRRQREQLEKENLEAQLGREL